MDDKQWAWFRKFIIFEKWMKRLLSVLTFIFAMVTCYHLYVGSYVSGVLGIAVVFFYYWLIKRDWLSFDFESEFNRRDEGP